MKIFFQLFLSLISIKAYSYESCKNDRYYDACVNVTLNQDPSIFSEYDRLDVNPDHRREILLSIENKLSEPIHCEVGVISNFADFDVENLVDGCFSSPAEYPRTGDQENLKVTLYEGDEYLKKIVTPILASSIKDETEDSILRPMICNADLAISCQKGCPAGEVLIDGQCTPGCAHVYEGKSYKIRKDQSISLESVVKDANGLNCNKDSITLKCSVENGRPAVSTNRTLTLRGIQSGSSCVAGCVWKEKKFLPGQKTEETDTDLSQECSISKRTYTCPSGGGAMIAGNQSTTFRGVTIANKCVEGCFIGGRAVRVGARARVTNNPIYSNGKGFNKNCFVKDVEYRCNSNRNYDVYKDHTFNGYADTKGECSRVKGCIKSGKKYDSGDLIFISYEGCGGGADYSREIGERCSDGSIRSFNTVTGTCFGGPDLP